MIKKMTACVLVLIMVLSFVACGSGVQEKSQFTDNINKYLEKYSEQMAKFNKANKKTMDEYKKEMQAAYGENKEITGDYDKDTAAKCSNGTFVGKKDENGIVTWKGVPYATQPVGDLRWKVVKDAPKSDKVYEAYYFGHSSIQCESNDDRSSLYPQGEDCLNVTIWNNKNDNTKNKPVMLYIHGGAYVEGGASEPMYDCTNFVTNESDVILASVDYRTGCLGFINLSEVPGGEEYKESANLGLLDIAKCLEWMKENIAAFGGDPDNITIFGESAGSGSVSAMTIIPQAKGLFKRGIMESGTSSGFLRTAEKSKDYTAKMMEISGAKDMKDLLSLTPDDLRNIMTIILMEDPVNYTYPQCDGITLPMDIKAAMEKNTREGIDILIGTNQDEMKYWTYYDDKDSLRKTAEARFDLFYSKSTEKQKEDLDKFLESYDDSDILNYYVPLYNYLGFHTNSLYEAKTHADNGQNAYMYYFTEESTNKEVGSCHAFEVRYVFGNLNDLSLSDAPADETLSDVMQTAWINFARTGDPSIKKGQVEGVDELKWEKYKAPDYPVMVFNSEGSHMENDPLNADNELIKSLKDIELANK